MHTCYLASLVASQGVLYPTSGLYLSRCGMCRTHWLIPYFQVWHTPQLLAHPSLAGFVDATPIIRYLNLRMYTKHGPRSMDHPCGPGPWTTLWTVDLVHGPGPWTTFMDLVHGPPLGLIFIIHVHAQYMWVPQYGGFRAEITVRLWTLAEHNLPMSDEIPTVVGQNVCTTFFFCFRVQTPMFSVNNALD